MNHIPFPNRVKQLENGILEKPYTSKHRSKLQEMIDRQVERGWRLKKKPYLHEGYWYAILVFERGKS